MSGWHLCHTCGKLAQVPTFMKPGGVPVHCSDCASKRSLLQKELEARLQPEKKWLGPREAAEALWGRLPIAPGLTPELVEGHIRELEATIRGGGARQR